MTDKAPERFQFPDRITVSFVANPSDAYDLWACEPSTFGAEYVPATALEAAHAQISALEDTLNIERAMSDGAHKRARNTRRDAYAECAAIADDWYHRSGHGSPGDDIRATLEALEKGDNHGVG